MGRVIPVLVGLFALAIAVAVCLHFQNAPTTPPPQATPVSPAYDAARATLARLPVKGWDRNTDFARTTPTPARRAFTRGPTTSEAVQIYHVISLSDAWCRGAREWDDQRRRDFANDPRNLLTVVGQANFDKAFRDATAWLPPNQAFRCQFVARQIDVKAAYGLWVSKNEKRAMDDVLARC